MPLLDHERRAGRIRGARTEVAADENGVVCSPCGVPTHRQGCRKSAVHECAPCEIKFTPGATYRSAPRQVYERAPSVGRDRCRAEGPVLPLGRTQGVHVEQLLPLRFFLEEGGESSPAPQAAAMPIVNPDLIDPAVLQPHPARLRNQARIIGFPVRTLALEGRLEVSVIAAVIPELAQCAFVLRLDPRACTRVVRILQIRESIRSHGSLRCPVRSRLHRLRTSSRIGQAGKASDRGCEHEKEATEQKHHHRLAICNETNRPRGEALAASKGSVFVPGKRISSGMRTNGGSSSVTLLTASARVMLSRSADDSRSPVT